CWLFFFFQAEDGIRDFHVTGVQTCALPILAVADGGHAVAHRRTRAGLGQRVGDRHEAAGDGRGARATVGLDDVAVHPHRTLAHRSEERRVGKEWRAGWGPEHYQRTEEVSRR